MLNYWFRIASGTVMKLSNILYKLMLNVCNEIECKWIKFVEKTLRDLGLSNIWMNQCNNFNFNWFKVCVNRRLYD